MNGHYTDSYVTVYSDVVSGNPLKGKDIVRYLLYKPGLMSLNKVPGPTDFTGEKVFVFSQAYNTVKADEDHVMFLPMLNLHIFRDHHRPRKGVCHYIWRHPPKWMPIDAEVIDHKLMADQWALSEYLNSVEVMYGYSCLSAMYDIARLCGCRVVLLPQDDKYRLTYDEVKKYEPFKDMNGVSWEKDEERKVDSTALREHYIGMVKLFDKKIDRFIELTQ